MKIPIEAAKQFANEYNCRQVVILAFDNEAQTHIVTYGQSEQDCDDAARGGNEIKKLLKWPSYNDEPHRVTKLKDRIKELEDKYENN